jgi:RNA polymerase sigma factor (sigma-70 family)
MVTPEESAALYRGCRSNDPRLRDPAYQRLRQLILPCARRALAGSHSEDMTEDCVQEALGRIWRKLQGPHAIDPDKFVAYAATAVSRVALDAVAELYREAPKRGRLRVPRDALVSLDETERDGQPIAESLADSAALQPDDFQQRLEIQRLLAGIGELGTVSEKSRTVILRGFLADWDDKDLADHLSTTTAAVEQIRYRDLERLWTIPDFVASLARYYPERVNRGPRARRRSLE